MENLIIHIRHPEYEDDYTDWEKWRLAAKGGRQFINRYLYKYSSREDQSDFDLRKSVTYCPAFAKSAIDEIKNSIFQRITDVVRTDGSKSYQDAVEGKNGGVDRRGSTMNSFMGRKILPELLQMKKIGVYTDRVSLPDVLTKATNTPAPYLYTYKVEDILSWTEDPDNDSEYVDVFLREYNYIYHTNYANLICGEEERYRHAFIDEQTGFLNVEFFDKNGNHIDRDGLPSDIVYTLKLRKIPFAIAEITESLMADTADYQISLLNIASAGVAQAIHSNYPIYVEQANSMDMMNAMQRQGDGTASEAGVAGLKEVTVGTLHGRLYREQPPSFIAPPTEPLKACLELQTQLKAEIRELVHLAVSNLQPRMQSAESKGLDNQGLEAGLSYIGLELNHLENRIAEHWTLYEGSGTPATVKYPEQYDIKSDADRQAEADALTKQMPKIPSPTYQRTLAKRISRLQVGREISNDKLQKIYQEIDDAKVIIVDPDVLAKDVELGVISKALCAESKNYPKDDIEVATQEHLDRVLALAQAQAAKQGPAGDPGARGVNDLSADPLAGKKEKEATRNTDTQDQPHDATRGKGK